MANDSSTESFDPQPALGGQRTVAPTGRRAESLLALRAGEQVGRYLVLSLLGEGGFGQVFLGFDEHLKRKVALKVLHADVTEDSRQRFRREGEALARLAHPNVVSVFDVAEYQGHLVLAMEYVRGQALGQWAQGRGWREVMVVMLQAARGLEAAHQSGLVHRDFKPANVLVGEDGRARVADFGLASRAEPEGSRKATPTTPPGVAPAVLDAELSVDGLVRGTPFFMAPEVSQGDKATAASDQYSYARTLQRLLEGAARGEGVDQVPAWVDAMIERGLSPSSSRRWPSMQATAAEIEARLGLPPEIDPNQAAPARRLISAALAVGSVGPPALAAALLGQRARQMDFLVAAAVWALLATAAIFAVGHRALRSSVDVQRHASAMALFVVAMLVNRVIGWHWGAPIDRVLTIDLLLFAVVLTEATLYIRRWLVSSVALTAAGIALCVLYPAWALVTFIVLPLIVLLQMLWHLRKPHLQKLGFLDSYHSQTSSRSARPTA